MQDVCIQDQVKVVAYDPIPVQESPARSLAVENVALRLLVGIVARDGDERQPWQIVNEAFALAYEFLRQAKKE